MAIKAPQSFGPCLLNGVDMGVLSLCITEADTQSRGLSLDESHILGQS